MSVAGRASLLLEQRTGMRPDCVGTATGRVNLIGDHVDYAGGCVMPVAIAEETAVAIVALPAGEDDALHSGWIGDPRWQRYVRGVVAELRAAGVAVPPCAVAVESDVPVGAGLSSSAALEVATARAALELTRTELAPREIALLCQRAEHRHAGVPCGIMDQWCVAHSRPGSRTAEGPEAMLLDCARLEHAPVPIPRTLRIRTMDSGVRHALYDGGYASRRADVEEAARLLGVGRLAEVGLDRLPEVERLPGRLARRARHVVTECARVHAARTALVDCEPERLGEILCASHRSLRDDFEVSVPELDRLVDQAIADGAFGARLTGAGFGGSVVAIFPD